MTENTKAKNDKIKYNKGLIVKITSKMVSSIHVFNAIMQCPEFIVFTKNVKKFDMLAFKNVDCDRIDFSTAINLEKIGRKCFKNAKNIHWSEVLENADQEPDSFEDASIIGKNFERENTI